MTYSIEVFMELQRVARVSLLLDDPKSREQLTDYRQDLETASAKRLRSRPSALDAERQGA